MVCIYMFGCFLQNGLHIICLISTKWFAFSVTCLHKIVWANACFVFAKCFGLMRFLCLHVSATWFEHVMNMVGYGYMAAVSAQ